MLDYSRIDIQKVLDYYSISNIKEYGVEINFSCPLDGHARGDRHPSAYINKETGMFHCFSCQAKGSLATLISKLEDIPLAVAIRWLRESYGGSFSQEPLMPLLKEAINNAPKFEAEQIISDAALLMFKVDWEKVSLSLGPPKQLQYMLDRGLSYETLEEFDIGFDTDSNRITFPIRNERGQLVGFKGRATRKDQKPKYLALGDTESIYYGFKTSPVHNYVWGIDTAGEPKIVVEGEIDAMKLRQRGFSGAVALGGSHPSKKQLDSLKKNSESVILMLDPDESGSKAEELLKELELFIPVRIAKLMRVDPADSSHEEIEEALDLAYNSIKI